MPDAIARPPRHLLGHHLLGHRLLAGRALRLRWRLARGLSRRRRALALQRLRRFRAFSAADYRALNPDLSPLVASPAAHALFHGSCAGRPLFRTAQLADTLGALVVPVEAPVQPTARDLAALAARAPRVGIHVSSLGNVFMQDIASDLAAALAAVGVTAVPGDESASPTQLAPFNIFVAPHEFFVLGRGRDWVREGVIAPAVMLNTEQAQTRWFAQALPFLLSARGVIDLSAQMCALLAETGLPCLHLTLTPGRSSLASADRHHALFRALPPAAQEDADPATPFAARTLDLAFFGIASPRREAFFARNAAFFADHDCFLCCRRADAPMRAAGAEGALSRLAQHVSGHARITLNLHRDEIGYFEWHRIVRLGMTAGSVVVSEPCLSHPAFRPGVHYFETPQQQMPELIAWLLLSADGRAAAERVRANVHRLLAGASTHAAARLLSFLLGDVPA